MQHRRPIASLALFLSPLALLPTSAWAQDGMGTPLLIGAAVVVAAVVIVLLVLRRRGSVRDPASPSSDPTRGVAPPAASKSAKAWDEKTPRLVDLDPEMQGEWTGFDEDEVLVGRVSTSEVGVTSMVIDKPTVSRKHARFELTGEQWFLTDLGSGNGTFVNDTALHGRHALRNADLIRFDAFVFRFDWPTDPGAPAKAAASTGAADKFTPEGTMITHGQAGAAASSGVDTAISNAAPAADMGATAQFTPDMLPGGLDDDKTEAMDFAATAMLPPDQRPSATGPTTTAPTTTAPAAKPAATRPGQVSSEDFDLGGDTPFPIAGDGDDATDVLMPGTPPAEPPRPTHSTPTQQETEDRDDTDLLPEDTGAANPFPNADEDNKTEVLSNPASPNEFDGTLMLTAEQLRNQAASLPDPEAEKDDHKDGKG
ncbi:MAG: FHA domain-containing protein [Gammaproteobacteria bacterium]